MEAIFKQQYFRNPFQKQNETYTGDRSKKDLQVAKKSFDPRRAILGNGGYVHLAEKHNALFESKLTMKSFILVYFQCDFWILHLKDYTKYHA